MALHPRHRGDCFDLYSAPDQTETVEYDMPPATRSALEQAAAQAGRTWNDHVIYVMELSRGALRPDFDDARSVADWRTLLGLCRFRTSAAGDWIPCMRLWGQPDRKAGDHDA